MNVRTIGLAGLVVLAIASGVASSSEIATAKVVHDARITHLNVRVREIVQLDTFCISQDGARHPLYFDRSSDQFEIPEGYSFVVTDINVYPALCEANVDAGTRWLFSLEGLDGRYFQVSFRGDTTMHYGFTSGIAYGPDNVPAVRMIRDPALNTGLLDVQVLGYFVRGQARPVFPG
jgi:hypothetical protein